MKTAATRLQDIVSVIIILTTCLIAYYVALTKVGFVSDDFFWMPFFQYTPSELINLLVAQRAGEINLIYFRPTVVASHQLEYIFYGDNPFGYHLTNVLIHSGNAMLLYAFCRMIRLNNITALISSMFFAVYPGHSEIVVWISGRADLLALFFLLISLVFWCKTIMQKRFVWFILSVIAFVLALMAKEVAAAGILIFPIISLYFHISGDRISGLSDKNLTHWKMYGILWLCLIGNVLLRYFLFGDIGGHTDVSGHSKYFSIDFDHIWLVINAFVIMLFTPVSDAVWSTSESIWRFSIIAAGIIVGLALVALLYSLIFSKDPREKKILLAIYVLIGVTWIIFMFLPVIPLLPVMRTLIRARFMYSPSVGLSILFGLGAGMLFSLNNRKAIKIMGLVSLLLVLASSTYLLNRQNLIWAESSKVSEKVNAIIVSNTEQLGDNGTIVLVNVPIEEGYKGIECMPIMTPEYFRLLFGFENVKIIFTTKESDDISEWWTTLKENKSDVVGFVCDGDIESLQPLP